MNANVPDLPAFQRDVVQLMAGRQGTLVSVSAETGLLRAVVNPGAARQPTPPGSLFKLAIALAALQPAATAGTTRRCQGVLADVSPGPALRCWLPSGHGQLGLEEALALSCNVYFAGLGRELGEPAVRRWGQRVGFLPAKQAVAPRLEAWIGEGAQWSATPWTLAAFAAALSREDGRRFEPSWHQPVASLSPLGFGARTRERLLAGMRLASTRGSARAAGRAGLLVYGKSGTATYLDGSNRTWGWFVGFGRVAGGRAPTLALAVRLGDASGFGDAAPLAGQVFARWAARGTP